ncbi:MAG: DUF3604 domain-containing protein [Chitinophagales bacterium]|nr:DUF3604 domain-containing protein [Chitinophagales bacterium]MCZ2392551.1 DUF3604 domain-containing protein [Chitinophagales bacterium]
MLKYIFLWIALLLCFSSQAQEKSDLFSAYITPDTAVAGEKSSFSIIIKAEELIKANTLFKIKFIKGFKDLQNILANAPGYVKASMSVSGGIVGVNAIKSSYDENLPFWEMNVQDKVITIITRNVDMSKGDSIIVAVGQGGANSAAIAPTTANIEEVEIAMANNGTASNVTLTTNAPNFEIKAKLVKTIYLFASSVARVGQSSKLLITNADEYFNINKNFTGEVFLNANSPSDVIIPTKVTFTPQDSGKKEIEIFYLKEGSYVINGTVSTENIPVVSSNPIRVENDRPFIYWGDLHSHGAPSRDAIGRGRYDYARYARGLDFMCATDHADHGKTIYGLSDREWARQKAEVKASHQPGKFISFIGYENSFLYPTGHYNIIFNVKDENIDNVPMWPMRVVKDIQTIWSLAQQQNIDVLTIPHHCGKVFNVSSEGSECKNCNTFGGIQYNEKYKRLIEIYSFHGLSESYDPNHNLSYYNRSKISRSFNGPNYAQDAWAIGEKLGVIASSDDHIGHPGSIVNGVAAVLANELDRDTLFQALKNRHSYGTTGERIWVDFKVNGALMGSTLKILPTSHPKISFDIMGTDSIDYVEVLKWDFKRGVYENAHPKYEIIARYNTDLSHPKVLKAEFYDEGFSDSCLYYLRVKQTNRILDFIEYKEVWAWTSPVWVSHSSMNVNESDSLKSYLPKIEGKRVRHFWSMYNISQVTQYQIEKKSQQGVWQTLFSFSPTDPYQLDFEYVELYPDNGKSLYRLKYLTSEGETKYSQEQEIFLLLDSISSFSYSIDSGTIVLHWVTDKELHTDRYVIERLNEGVFQNIASVNADIDLGDILSQYSWPTNISQSGIYYFRLSQFIDNQVVDTLNLVVEIMSTGIKNIDLSKEFVLKSNLLTSGQFLEFKISDRLKGSIISIVDADGRLLKEFGRIQNIDTWNSLSMNGWAAASYWVIIRTKENRILQVPFVLIP